jgi:hypothetical protein
VLPNFTGIFPTGSDTAANTGKTVAAGLPNITATFGSHQAGLLSGCVVNLGSANSADIGDDGTSGSMIKVKLDASSSNSIYGKSNTVQPPAIKVRFIIKAK